MTLFFFYYKFVKNLKQKWEERLSLEKHVK